ncbi:MAG: hypothetical protein GY841_16055 [FCB group bacterium]|nr:hypothetical protein [FCB group bacterium]
MAETIKDGTGKGYLAKVNDENMLDCWSVCESVEHHSNHDEKQAYHVLFNKTATGAGDCIFYAKNDSDTDLIVEGFWFRVASAEQVQIKIGDTGTPASGTTITPVNNNAGSSNAAEGTFEHGTDITGLSGGSVVEKYWLTSTASEMFNFEQDIVLPKNLTLTIYVVSGSVDVAGTMVFHYHGEGA